MIFRLRRVHAFSLVEVAIALGIAAFCLLAVFGLMPIGVQTNRNATSQTAAANILSTAVSDLRNAPVPKPTPSPVPSALYVITIPATDAAATPAPQIRYFDSEGRCSCNSAGSQKPNPMTGDCSDTWSPPLQTRYQLTITFPQASPTPIPPALPTTYAYLKLIWPAAATTANASGSAEIFAAFDRN
jgi:type II secretory pathway pseudopilin PulG